ncbi:MAG: LamG domain-containing protein, partial [Sedimentisphaerales bacterium]|nr:LamG domain-containing protein [Sedimentisphaerales bacterium]
MMYKKAVSLVTFVLVVSLVQAGFGADTSLVGWWRLEDGSGTVAKDSSNYGNDGTLVNGPTWVTGKWGGALKFNGVDQWVEAPHNETLTVDTEVTVMAWINTERYKGGATASNTWQGIVSKGNAPRSYSFYTKDGGNLHFSVGPSGGYYGSVSTGTLPLNEWVHVCAMVIDGEHQYYIDGEDAGRAQSGVVLPGSSDTSPVYFGRVAAAVANTAYLGMIDDVRIYRRGLSQEEVLEAMNDDAGGSPLAYGPSPEDGAVVEAAWANLSWNPGDFAVSHDIYFGTDFDDVNEGIDTFVGNTTSTFQVVGFPGFPAPGGLQPGTAYYWRVDEVNEADPNSPWKGHVWSFFVPSKTAYNPNPADGQRYVDPEITLSWMPGTGAIMHTVYFGDNFDEINSAAGGNPQPEATYNPGELERGKTYYWRVDEFDGIVTNKGAVWSFTTKPDIPITNPELLCWWSLDEGQGTIVLDRSGHGADGTIVGHPQWVDGVDGGALNFDGAIEAVTYNFEDETWTAYTLAVWAKSNRLNQVNNSGICATYLTTNGGFQLSYDNFNNYQYHADVDQILGPASLGWVHLAVTYDGAIATAYYNGEFVATFTPGADDLLANKYGLGVNRVEDHRLDGSVDDFRVYSRALSQEEIQEIMRGDPLLAWRPSPADGSNPDIDSAIPLSWSPGESASQHDVYVGTDKDAVTSADATDTTGIYRGRQSARTYTPGDVEWGGGPYYWRVDEVNTDGTVTKGRIWDFTVADFILVDDFESYTDDDANGKAIWQAWLDGYGVADNGSQVGYLLPPYAEKTIVNSGLQSMPFVYDNTSATNSEAAMALTTPRDWTRHGLAHLSLWFQGYPASDGSFIETPAGTYTMTASGADIWGTADEFHLAYKTLTGTGSIIAKVNSVENTNGWAKAGVMIRETLDAGSKYAFACITPENGVAFQGRTATDGTCFSTSENGIAAPHWVKLERDASGNFSVSHSTNGTTWQAVADSVPTNISMTSSVYIGLALTSHDAAQTCQAVFSNVTTSGNVSGQW